MTWNSEDPRYTHDNCKGHQIIVRRGDGAVCRARVFTAGASSPWSVWMDEPATLEGGAILSADDNWPVGLSWIDYPRW